MVYMENAKITRESLEKAGLRYYGEVLTPPNMDRTPEGMDSWQFF